MPLQTTHFFPSLLEISDKIINCRLFVIFSEISHFFKISGNLGPHQSGAGISSLRFYHIHIDLRYTLDKVFFGFSWRSSFKTLSTRLNSGGVVPFFAGPSLASLAIVSVLLFEREEHFHSTSHSSRRKNTPTLRVITLREGRILPLYESLLEKEEYSHSTSHYSSWRKNTSTLRIITRRAGVFPMEINLLASKTRTSAGARLLPHSSS